MRKVNDNRNLKEKKKTCSNNNQKHTLKYIGAFVSIYIDEWLRSDIRWQIYEPFAFYKNTKA